MRMTAQNLQQQNPLFLEGAKLSEGLFFRGHFVQIQRKPYRRSLSLKFDEKGLTLLASLKTSEKHIQVFLKQSQKWIDRVAQELQSKGQRYPEKKFVPQERFPFLGDNKSLVFKATTHKKLCFEIENHQLVCLVPEKKLQKTFPLHLKSSCFLFQMFSKKDWVHFYYTNREDLTEALQKFYKSEAVFYLSQRVKFWSEKMNLKPKKVIFRNQKTCWGSCSDEGTVSLNFRLMVFSQAHIDYVVIHELAHLKHLNHSASFWKLVSQFCPEYKKYKNHISKESALADFLS